MDRKSGNSPNLIVMTSRKANHSTTTRRNSVWLLAVLAWMGLSGGAHAQGFAVGASTYDQKGSGGERSLSAGTPNERVDPFTGNLIISQTDLTLPGKGGLDVTITRVYNSKVHENYGVPGATLRDFVPPSVVGLGWTIHMGRIVRKTGDSWTAANDSLSGARYYEAPDGGRHVFFQAECGEASVAGNQCSSGVLMTTKGLDKLYFSTSPSSLDANWDSFPILATADGRVIEFAYRHTSSGYQYWSATRITDAWGNSIEIEYLSPAEVNQQACYPQTQCAPSNRGYSLIPGYISRITDTWNREINFEYADLGRRYNCPLSGEAGDGMIRLHRITVEGISPTRGHEYEYAAHCNRAGSALDQNPNAHPLNASAPRALLTAAGPIGMGPDYRFEYLYGESTTNKNVDGDLTECGQNQYRHCELTKLSYPTGAVVSYDYGIFDAYVTSSYGNYAFRAVQKRAIEGPQLQTASWEYDYDRDNGSSKSYHTRIVYKEGTQTIAPQEQYFYYGAFPYRRPNGSTSNSPEHGQWKSGVVLEKKLLDGSSVVQTDTYEWQKSYPVSLEDTWEDLFLGRDEDIWVPQLAKITTTRGSSTWETENTTFSNTTLQPICTTNTGPGGDESYSLRRTTAAGWAYEAEGDSDGTADATLFFAALPALSLTTRDGSEFSTSECAGSSNPGWYWSEASGEFRTYELSGSWGGLESIETNTEKKRFQYHTSGLNKGLLKAEILHLTDDRGVCTRFNDYDYGVPTDTDHGIRVNGRTASCPSSGTSAWSTSATVNSDGTVDQGTNARGKKTSHEYDRMGRVTKTTYVGRNTPEKNFQYKMSQGSSIDGRSVKVCSGSCSGSRWGETLMDGLGRTIGSRNSADQSVYKEYDGRGRERFGGFPGTGAPSKGQGIETKYDALGRVVKKWTASVTPAGCEEYIYAIDGGLEKTTSEPVRQPKLQRIRQDPSFVVAFLRNSGRGGSGARSTPR